QPVKRVGIIDLLVVTRSAHLWSRLSDEDAVKDAYPWGDYIWKAFYRRTVNVISRHRAAVMARNQKNASIRNKKKKSPTSKKNESYNVYGFVLALKKDPLVIPRGLSWSKIGNFEKGDYVTLFAELSNPILSMAPTSNKLLQPWFIHSMEYFGSHDVEHEPLLIDHEIPVGEKTVISLDPDVALESQFEAEIALERKSKPDVPIFTREELVAERHAIKERVQIIENLEMLIHKLFSNSWPLLRKGLVVPKNSLSDILNGEFSCDINRPNEHMFEEFIENKFECGDGNDNASFDFDNTENHSLNDMVRTETEDIHLDELLSENGDQLLNTLMLLKEKCIKVMFMLIKVSWSKSVSDDDHDVMFISLEDWENAQLNKTRKRKDAIRLSKIAKSKFPLVEYCEVMTIADETTHLLAWGNYDIEVDRSFLVNSVGFEPWWLAIGQSTPADADWATAGQYFCDFVMRECDIPGWVCYGVRTHYCLGVLHISFDVITLYDSMGVSVQEIREWWSNMRIAFKTRILQYLRD
nr:hypothetical protein [Tanacetum cinerariifolium]